MEYGWFKNGFIAKRFPQIIDDVNADTEARFGPNVSTDPSSVIQQFNGIYAGSLSELWARVQELQSRFDPAQSRGANLSQWAYWLTGQSRLEDRPSKVRALFKGTAGTVIPENSEVKDIADNIWLVLADTQIGTDGTIIGWLVSKENEAILAEIKDISTINTPITGWENVYNIERPEPGGPTETDEELSRRIFNESASLFHAQNITDDLEAKLLLLPGIDDVGVVINDTNCEVNDMPPHSYGVVIQGQDYDETAIAQTIHNTHPTGITTVGAVSILANDTRGRCKEYKYQPACKIYIAIDVFIQFHCTKCCTNYDIEKMRMTIFERGKELIGKCAGWNIGDQVNRNYLYTAFDQFAGVDVQEIRIARRAPMLFVGDPAQCEDKVPTVLDETTGEQILWINTETCLACESEIWCPTEPKSVCLKWFEYPDVDLNFINIIDVGGESPCCKKNCNCECSCT